MMLLDYIWQISPSCTAETIEVGFVEISHVELVESFPQMEL